MKWFSIGFLVHGVFIVTRAGLELEIPAFWVRMPNHYIIIHPKKNAIYGTFLPSSSFPESYKLPSFKSKINKLDLISLSS